MKISGLDALRIGAFSSDETQRRISDNVKIVQY